MKNILLNLSKPFPSYKCRRSRPMQNDRCGRGLSCDYHRFCTLQALDQNYTLVCLGLQIPRGLAVGVPCWPDQQWHLKALNDFETLSQWAHATMKPAGAHNADIRFNNTCLTVSSLPSGRSRGWFLFRYFLLSHRRNSGIIERSQSICL